MCETANLKVLSGIYSLTLPKADSIRFQPIKSDYFTGSIVTNTPIILITVWHHSAFACRCSHKFCGPPQVIYYVNLFGFCWLEVSIHFIRLRRSLEQPHRTKFSLNNRPQYEALGNNYRVCGVYFPEPHAEVYCFRLTFNISKLFYCLFLSFNYYSIYKAIVFLNIYSTTDSWAEWMYTSC